jgi:hypothetical protein
MSMLYVIVLCLASDPKTVEFSFLAAEKGEWIAVVTHGRSRDKSEILSFTQQRLIELKEDGKVTICGDVCEYKALGSWPYISMRIATTKTVDKDKGIVKTVLVIARAQSAIEASDLSRSYVGSGKGSLMPQIKKLLDK